MQPSLRGPASCCDFPPAHPRNPPSSLMNPHRRHRLELALVSALAFLAAIAPAQALAAASTKTVSFHGYRLAVPLSWPVYHLQANGTRCVRFDRHAVYLGQPSSRQQCPATPAGRTEAILVEQQRGSIRDLPVATAGGATATQFVDRTHHVVVTATWDRRPSLIRRAPGGRSPPPASPDPAGPRRPFAARGHAAPRLGAGPGERAHALVRHGPGGDRLDPRPGLHRFRVRCLQHPQLIADDRLGGFAVPGHR